MHTTFWGAKQEEIRTQDEQARQKMGPPKSKKEWVGKDCQNQEAENTYKEKSIQSEHLNARQAFRKVRGATPEAEAFIKCVALKLSEKRMERYSEIVSYLRRRFSFDILRTCVISFREEGGNGRCVEEVKIADLDLELCQME